MTEEHIPVAIANAHASVSQRHVPAPIIDDDNIYMLKNRLFRAGFTVIVATDGRQGIAMATSEQPDVILMDLTLPDIRGEEATQRRSWRW
jgi:DNA-binding response OmpR family regulator